MLPGNNSEGPLQVPRNCRQPFKGNHPDQFLPVSEIYLGRNPSGAATWGRITPLPLLPGGGTHLLHILRDFLQLLEGGLVRCEHGEQGPEARGHRAEVYSLSHGGGGEPQHGALLPAQVCLLVCVRSFRCMLTSRLSLTVTHCFSYVSVCVFVLCGT